MPERDGREAEVWALFMRPTDAWSCVYCGGHTVACARATVGHSHGENWGCGQ